MEKSSNELCLKLLKTVGILSTNIFLSCFITLLSILSSLLASMSMMDVNDVIELQILSFVYQWSHRLLPPCFNEYFKFTSSVHSYSTRQSCNRNLFVASVNTTQYGLRSLKFTGPRLWNSLPTSITNSNSLRMKNSNLP